MQKTLNARIMVTEKWVIIPGYPDYLINKKSKIKSIKDKLKPLILSKNINCYRYNTVRLYNGVNNRTYQVSILMAITFLNHKSCGWDLVVDHKDGNTLNDELSNLQVITQKANVNKGKKRTNMNPNGTIIFGKSMNKWRFFITSPSGKRFRKYFKTEQLAKDFQLTFKFK